MTARDQRSWVDQALHEHDEHERLDELERDAGARRQLPLADP